MAREHADDERAERVRPRNAPNALDRTTKRPNKPSAYSYYQKLVQDFASLDDELRAAQHEHNTLASTVSRLQTRDQTAAQQLQCEREDEHKTDDIAALHAQMAALDARERQLVAEIELLHETQQAQVHAHTRVLDAEFASGRLDTASSAQVEQQSREQSHTLQQTQMDGQQDEAATKSVHSSEAIHALVDDVQRHRPLEVLSTHQQQTIATFFASPPARIAAVSVSSQHQHASDTVLTGPTGADVSAATSAHAVSASTASPQVDVIAILASLHLSGIQAAQNETLATRTSTDDALRDAQALLRDSAQRFDALKLAIASRMREVEALDNPFPTFTYNGALGITSYAAHEVELMYYVRALVLHWVDNAVDQAHTTPERWQLEAEVLRWETTHRAVVYEHELHARASATRSIFASMLSDVLDDVARSIHAELVSSSMRVRTAFDATLCDVLFSSVASTPVASRTSKTKTTSTTVAANNSNTLAAALFNSAVQQLRVTRLRRAETYAQRTHECGMLLPLRTQPVMAVKRNSTGVERPGAAAALSTSPTKKHFSFFSSSKSSEHAPAKTLAAAHATAPAAPGLRVSTALDGDSDDTQHITELRAESAAAPAAGSGNSDASANDQAFWQQMRVEIDECTAPATFAHASCVVVAADASVCIVGTTSGEVLLWDLLQHPPLLLRTHVPPPKMPRARVLRIAISANNARILTLDAFHVVHLWSVRSSVAQDDGAAAHSSDCFGVAPHKWKPQPLELLVDVRAESLLEPAAPERVQQLLTVTSKATSKPTGTALPQVLCTSFFATASLLLGDPCSLLCGTVNGDIFKLNTRGAQRRDIAAAFDMPLPSDLAHSLQVNTVARECLRGHRHAVLFVTSLARTEHCAHERIVSVDSDANVLEWTYAAEHFSGCGWFTPMRRYRLDLSGPTSSSSWGEILQIATTADEQQLVLMVFFTSDSHSSSSTMTKKNKETHGQSGTLRFYQLELADAIRVLPVRVEIEYVASSAPAPRFAVTTALSPPSCDKQSSSSRYYLFVLQANSVSIYATQTGARCCAPIALAPALVFDAIAVSAWGADRSCCMVVTGERHSHAVVYRFHSPL